MALGGINPDIIANQLNNANEQNIENDQAIADAALNIPENPAYLNAQRAQKAMDQRAHFRNRKAFRQMVSRATPDPSKQGTFDKADHLAGLTAEGIAAEMIMNLLFLSAELVLHANYVGQHGAFYKAMKDQFDVEFPHGVEKISMAYTPNANGFLPPIYPEDENGEPDFTQDPLVGPEITRHAIRLNGYVPEPSWTESVEMAFDSYWVHTYGVQQLSATSLMRLYGKSELSPRSANHDDTASDMTAITAGMRPTAHLKPGG